VVLASSLGVKCTPLRVAVFVESIGGGVIFLAASSFSFWSIESLKFADAFTPGRVQMAQYSFFIYRCCFRSFFTYAIPLGCVSYFPAMIITGSTAARPHDR